MAHQLNFLSSLSESPWRHVTTRNVAMATGAAGSVYFLWRWYRNRDLPPGPPSWPLIGSFSGKFSDENFEEELLKLKIKYGDVFSFRQGTSIKVVLASSAAIREARITNKDVFVQHPKQMNQAINEYTGFKDDIFSSAYDPIKWVKNKAFVVSTLRNAGFIKAEKILDQIGLLVNHLQSYKSQAIDLEDVFRKTTTNCISSVIFNEFLEYDDPQLDNLIKLVIDGSMAAFQAIYLSHMPIWLGKLLYRSKIRSMRENSLKIKTFIKEKILLHQTMLDPENPKDFIDIYLIKKGSEHDLDRIVNNVFTCMIDAVGNLPRGVYAAILHLAYYQDHQRKSLEEILKLTDGNRSIAWSDQSSLPYNEAAIMEVQRHFPLFSFLPELIASEDAYVKGYRIPKGSEVTMFTKAAFGDSRDFPEPDAFRPERFIGENGELVKSENLFPFGLGRRKCIGEMFAKMVLFLVTSNLIQHFHIEFPEGEKASLVPTGGPGFCVPQNFRVILTPRQ